MAKLTASSLVLFILITGICAHDQDFSDADDNKVYTSPIVTGFAYLAEHFDDADGFSSTWIKSEAKKEEIDEDIAKYDGK